MAVCSEGGGGDEWFGEEDRYIGDEVAGGGVVGAVEDDVVFGYDREAILGGEMLRVGDVGWLWIQTVMS